MSYYPNPLQQLIPPRVHACLERLKSLVWEDRCDLDVQGGPVVGTAVSLAEARTQPLKPVVRGESFAGPGDTWQQRWFKVKVPAAAPDQVGRRVLFWDSQGETTVYWKETPWAGIDIAHRYCPLPDEECELWLDTGTYQTAIWYDAPKAAVDEYGCRFDGAWIACRNHTAWDAFWDLSCVNELMNHLLQKDGWEGHGIGLKEPLDEVPVVLRRLLRGLDAVCNAFDADGLEAAAEQLRALFNELRAAPWQGKAALCGHAHIDLVWLWPESEGNRKAVHSFSTVLRLMEHYPEFRFTHSQPAAYSAVQKLAPDLHRQVVAKIRDGQWEATGGFEVESDVNLPCGEALARSLRYGQERFAELRGGDISHNVWIPDVFGYSNCLPQIMKLGGITSFFTTKMTWSSVTRFPHNAFTWRGADGSEVLAFLCPVGYNERVELSALTRCAHSNRQSGVYEVSLLPQGIGDGGGGPTEGMCERARRFSDLAEVPQTEWTRVEDYFQGLHAVIDELPVYQGELYLELHRGVYTTQAQLKHQYRAAERGLQAHEACRVFCGMGPLPKDDWLRLSFSQFHDALPGSSIGIVYEQLTPELREIAERQLAAARQTLEGDGQADTLYAFNPLGFPRTAILSLPKIAGQKRASVASGNTQEFIENGSACTLSHMRLPGLGVARPFEQADDVYEVKQAGCRDKGTLDNGLVQAAFNAQGQLEELCIDGETLSLTAPAGLVVYPDHPANYDAWDIDRHTLQLGRTCADDLALEVAANGPVRAVLAGKTSLGAASTVEVKYYVDADQPYLFVELSVDWHEEHKLLKYHLLTDYCGQMTRYGAPFGSTLRPQLPGYSSDESQWEVPGSRWAAVSNDIENTGIAVITEAKYGFSCRAGNLGLSLLRAPKNPDPNADQGRHQIRFAIGRHRTHSTAERLSTAAAAEALYAPVITFYGENASPPPLRLAELGTLVPSWILPAETGKGWILRAHESAGTGGTAILELRDQASGVRYVDFLEADAGVVEQIGDRTYRLEYQPYQVISVHVK